MARKCFISSKTEDFAYKRAIQRADHVDIIDKSLDDAINSQDEDYIMRQIRRDYLSDSTVTIFLIGENSYENKGYEQRFIKRELQASLYHGENNTQSGILGIVLPAMYTKIYSGPYTCNNCKTEHTGVNINDNTVIKEFSYNYYIPNNKCFHSEEDRFCVLERWDVFINDPNTYIEKAFQKRALPISNKTKVRP